MVDTFAISFIVKYLSFVTTAIHIVFYLDIFPEFAFLVVDIIWFELLDGFLSYLKGLTFLQL